MDLGLLSAYVIGGVIILFITCWIIYALYRWVFAINRQLWNQRQQINLLIKIAEKLGVDMNDMQTINYINNKKDADLN